MKTIKLALLTLGLSCGLVSTQAQNLLTNGNFEMGNDTGWSQIDGSYNSIVNRLSNPNSPYVFAGTYSGRRTMYSGSAVGYTTSFNSILYDATPGQQYLFEVAVLSNGQTGRFETFGRISFYDSAQNLITSFDTPHLLSSSSIINWTEYSLIATAPDNAAYFRVSGRTLVLETLTGAAYAGYDNFSVSMIPEPSHAAMAFGGLILLGMLARRQFRK